jgi:hypothetical protein
VSIGIVVFVAIIVAAFVIAVLSQVIGPSTLRRQFTEEMEKGTIRKRQRAATAAAFRDPAGGLPRFVAAGSRVLVEDHAYQVAGLSARPLSWSKAHELWIGEARPLAVDRPATVFSTLYEIARGMPAADKDPAVVGLPPLLDGALAERVRAVLRRSDVMARFAPTVHVGPSAWVLTSMTGKAAPRLAELLDLGAEVARALDGAASSARGRSD